MTIIDIAAIAHEVNRAYCEALGDYTLVAWQFAPEWQKQSIINGVEFHAGNPCASPDASHRNWLAEKIVTGWKWGPVKDAEKKEHPCFVAYCDLPVEQQAKDFIFKAVVENLLPHLTG